MAPLRQQMPLMRVTPEVYPVIQTRREKIVPTEKSPIRVRKQTLLVNQRSVSSEYRTPMRKLQEPQRICGVPSVAANPNIFATRHYGEWSKDDRGRCNHIIGRHNFIVRGAQ
jgi:hypothetical protein